MGLMKKLWVTDVEKRDCMDSHKSCLPTNLGVAGRRKSKCDVLFSLVVYGLSLQAGRSTPDVFYLCRGFLFGDHHRTNHGT